MQLNLWALIGLLIALWIAAAFAVRAIGGNIALVEDWRKAWKWYSAYGIVLLGLLPELFNALLAADVFSGTPIDQHFSLAAKTVAGITLALRMVNQLKKPALPTFGGQDKPGG
ncbi:MAG TPA: hypothetical protein VGK41_01210 [Solirubrobacterales bacterium]